MLHSARALIFWHIFGRPEGALPSLEESARSSTCFSRGKMSVALQLINCGAGINLLNIMSLFDHSPLPVSEGSSARSGSERQFENFEIASMSATPPHWAIDMKMAGCAPAPIIDPVVEVCA